MELEKVLKQANECFIIFIRVLQENYEVVNIYKMETQMQILIKNLALKNFSQNK